MSYRIPETTLLWVLPAILLAVILGVLLERGCLPRDPRPQPPPYPVQPANPEVLP